VLEYVRQDHDREAVVVGEVVERLLADVEAEHLAPVRGRAGRQLETHHLVAAPPRLIQKQPVTAAHVEQPPGGHVAPDQVEQAARGGAASGLLVEVSLVVHAAVEVVQIRPRGQRRLLHGAAITAHE
jgi:hypothetical protein